MEISITLCSCAVPMALFIVSLDNIRNTHSRTFITNSYRCADTESILHRMCKWQDKRWKHRSEAGDTDCHWSVLNGNKNQNAIILLWASSVCCLAIFSFNEHKSNINLCALNDRCYRDMGQMFLERITWMDWWTWTRNKAWCMSNEHKKLMCMRKCHHDWISFHSLYFLEMGIVST